MTGREESLAKVVASLSVRRLEQCSRWTDAQRPMACQWSVKRVFRDIYSNVAGRVILCLLNIIIIIGPFISLCF